MTIRFAHRSVAARGAIGAPDIIHHLSQPLPNLSVEAPMNSMASEPWEFLSAQDHFLPRKGSFMNTHCKQKPGVIAIALTDFVTALLPRGKARAAPSAEAWNIGKASSNCSKKSTLFTVISGQPKARHSLIQLKKHDDLS